MTMGGCQAFVPPSTRLVFDSPPPFVITHQQQARECHTIPPVCRRSLLVVPLWMAGTNGNNQNNPKTKPTLNNPFANLFNQKNNNKKPNQSSTSTAILNRDRNNPKVTPPPPDGQNDDESLLPPSQQQRQLQERKRQQLLQQKQRKQQQQQQQKALKQQQQLEQRQAQQAKRQLQQQERQALQQQRQAQQRQQKQRAQQERAVQQQQRQALLQQQRQLSPEQRKALQQRYAQERQALQQRAAAAAASQRERKRRPPQPQRRSQPSRSAQRPPQQVQQRRQTQPPRSLEQSQQQLSPAEWQRIQQRQIPQTRQQQQAQLQQAKQKALQQQRAKQQQQQQRAKQQQQQQQQQASSKQARPPFPNLLNTLQPKSKPQTVREEKEDDDDSEYVDWVVDILCQCQVWNPRTGKYTSAMEQMPLAPPPQSVQNTFRNNNNMMMNSNMNMNNNNNLMYSLDQSLVSENAWKLTTTGAKSLVVVLPVLGDLESLEYGQLLAAVVPSLRQARIAVCVIGIGATAESARLFCDTTGLPLECLYLDPQATMHKALQLHAGPQWSVPPWLVSSLEWMQQQQQQRQQQYDRTRLQQERKQERYKLNQQWQYNTTPESQANNRWLDPLQQPNNNNKNNMSPRELRKQERQVLNQQLQSPPQQQTASTTPYGQPQETPYGQGTPPTGYDTTTTTTSVLDPQTTNTNTNNLTPRELRKQQRQALNQQLQNQQRQQQQELQQQQQPAEEELERQTNEQQLQQQQQYEQQQQQLQQEFQQEQEYQQQQQQLQQQYQEQQFQQPQYQQQQQQQQRGDPSTRNQEQYADPNRRVLQPTTPQSTTFRNQVVTGEASYYYGEEAPVQSYPYEEFNTRSYSTGTFRNEVVSSGLSYEDSNGRAQSRLYQEPNNFYLYNNQNAESNGQVQSASESYDSEMDNRNYFNGEYKDSYNNESEMSQEDAQGWVNYLAMWMGIGAPDTVRELVRGAFGDPTAPERIPSNHVMSVQPFMEMIGTTHFRFMWDTHKQSSKNKYNGDDFDFRNTWWQNQQGYQRPMELTSLRLSFLMHFREHFNEYVSDPSLLAWRGCTFLLESEPDVVLKGDTMGNTGGASQSAGFPSNIHGSGTCRLLYEHRSNGILSYTQTPSRPLAFLEPYIGSGKALNPLGLRDEAVNDWWRKELDDRDQLKRKRQSQPRPSLQQRRPEQQQLQQQQQQRRPR